MAPHQLSSTAVSTEKTTNPLKPFPPHLVLKPTTLRWRPYRLMTEKRPNGAPVLLRRAAGALEPLACWEESENDETPSCFETFTCEHFLPHADFFAPYQRGGNQYTSQPVLEWGWMSELAWAPWREPFRHRRMFTAGTGPGAEGQCPSPWTHSLNLGKESNNWGEHKRNPKSLLILCF